jgi:hypothetical protein
MTWQEYQEAVGELYTKLEKMGSVKRNIFLPDKITGQKRQIDVLLEAEIGGHEVIILIDAKLRSAPVDVKDVEEIIELATAVKANKAVIVTNNGWTKPAETKANFHSLDLRILTIEKALDLIAPDKWFMCYNCKDECVVMDKDGVLFRKSQNLFFYWLAGSCRNCKNLYLYCDECGSRVIIEDADPWKCSCGHHWKYKDGFVHIMFKDKRKFLRIDNAAKPTDEFLFWLHRYDPKYWKDSLVNKIMTIGDDDGGLYSFIIPD